MTPAYPQAELLTMRLSPNCQRKTPITQKCFEKWYKNVNFFKTLFMIFLIIFIVMSEDKELLLLETLQETQNSVTRDPADGCENTYSGQTMMTSSTTTTTVVSCEQPLPEVITYDTRL